MNISKQHWIIQGCFCFASLCQGLGRINSGPRLLQYRRQPPPPPLVGFGGGFWVRGDNGGAGREIEERQIQVTVGIKF